MYDACAHKGVELGAVLDVSIDGTRVGMCVDDAISLFFF